MTIGSFGHFAPHDARSADSGFGTFRVELSKNSVRFGFLDLPNLPRAANRIILSLFVLKIFKIEFSCFAYAAVLKFQNSTLNILRTKRDIIILFAAPGRFYRSRNPNLTGFFDSSTVL